jgi:hypothetical protein
MKIIRTLVVSLALVSFASMAIAAGNPKCPKCHMELSSKKDKAHTEAVKIKGKTYYCCSACGAHKKAKAK